MPAVYSIDGVAVTESVFLGRIFKRGTPTWETIENGPQRHSVAVLEGDDGKPHTFRITSSR